jgi:hypothetical protein
MSITITKNQNNMRFFTKLYLLSTFILMSAVVAGQGTTSFTYISPEPGSKYVRPENTIALRQGEVFNASAIRSDHISVTGSLSGEIAGTIKLSKDRRTLIFSQESPYQFGEIITVEVVDGMLTEKGSVLNGVSFGFEVMQSDNYDMLVEFYARQHEENLKEMDFSSNQNPSKSHFPSGTRNATDYPEGFPVATVAEFDNPAPGYIFSGPRPMGAAPYDPYLLIMDNYGTPVFYRNWPRRTNDFKAIVNNQLTFCDFDRSNPTINKYLVMNHHFEFTDTLTMGNGYILDQHDMLMFENGDHFLMAYDPQLVNMDTVYPGGDTAATVVGFIIQKLDSEHNVIFQWRSWDHFSILDANHKDFTESHIDYVHGNAFEVDNDGNLMFSCRDMEEITKIDLESGEIIWRFGLHAQNNMFEFINDTIGFSWQHDIRRIPNGNVTVYDNGNWHTPQFSQALEYNLDETNFTAELVWNYIHDPVVYGRATGSHRRLANENAFICWGLTWPISSSEVTMDGDLAWELHWPESVWEYRVFKFDWKSDYITANLDTIDFGEYDDYVPWPRIFSVTNNADQEIQITSTHNHWDSYYVSTALPLTIPAGESANMTVNFFPAMEGPIEDILTINIESMYSDTLPQMISTQIVLKGSVADDNAPETSISPADGTLEVPQDSEVMISFDEPVLNANGGTLKVSELDNFIIFEEVEGEAVNYTAKMDVWKTKIILVPDTLKPNTEYYVELKANMVSDRSGNTVSDAQTSTFVTEEEQGIDESLLDNLSIYPNPTNGLFYLEVTDLKPVSVRVFDNSGRLVKAMESVDDQRFLIDLSHYNSGVYIVEVMLESGSAISKKILKN